MKYLASLLLVALIGHGAEVAAETQADAALASPSVSLILVLPDTKQALLKDQKRGTYVVVRVGDTIDGAFKVHSIAATRIVLGSVTNPAVLFVLPKIDPKAVAGKVASDNDENPPAAPVNPYKDPTPGAKSPASTVVNPYKDPTPGAKSPATTVINPYTTPPAAPQPTTPAQPATAKPAAPTPTPTPTPQPAPSKPADPGSQKPAAPDLVPIPPPNLPGLPTVAAPKPTEAASPAANKAAAPAPSAAPAPKARLIETRALPRAQLQAALANFEGLSKQAIWQKDSRGIRIAGLAQKSFFHQIGLRAGDVIVSVEGKAIRDVDDAAAIYATLLTAKTISVKLLRGSSHLTLDYKVVD